MPADPSELSPRARAGYFLANLVHYGLTSEEVYAAFTGLLESTSLFGALHRLYPTAENSWLYVEIINHVRVQFFCPITHRSNVLQ